MVSSTLTFKPIPADFSINLFESLVAYRPRQLQPALKKVVKEVGVVVIDRELHQLVSETALNHISSLGLRGELLFPVPSILKRSPSLIGYYRMLLGISKKEFSQPDRLGYSAWIRAEEKDKISDQLIQNLEKFCTALIEPLSKLLVEMGTFDSQDLSDLTLLTLGPSLQGGRNNDIGSIAATEVFRLLKSLVTLWIKDNTENTFSFKTPGGRTFAVKASGDPDIAVDEIKDKRPLPFLAIEIKGGADASNAHNRAGEAEKSHIKARGKGYRERWTIIRMSGSSRPTIQRETPTSTSIFETKEILGQSGPDWDNFKKKLKKLIGEN